MIRARTTVVFRSQNEGHKMVRTTSISRKFYIQLIKTSVKDEISTISGGEITILQKEDDIYELGHGGSATVCKIRLNGKIAALKQFRFKGNQQDKVWPTNRKDLAKYGKRETSPFQRCSTRRK